MTTNTEIKTLDQRIKPGAWLMKGETANILVASMEEASELRAALEAKQQALEAAQQRLAAIEPPSFSRDPDGDLALDWRVGDASLSVSFSASGLVSWATGVEGKSACGSQQVAQRAGSAVGKIVANDPVHGWHFVASVDWESIGDGRLLYTAPPAAVQPYFGYSDEVAAIEAAKQLCMLGKPLNEHGAQGLAFAFMKLRKPDSGRDAALVDTPELRRLVNAYRQECDLVQGHGVPAWRELVSYIAAMAAQKGEKGTQ